jgi:protocatechuate 3,4-dioxygenase beta subunit
MLNLLFLLLSLNPQDPSATVKQIDDQLAKGTVTINAILSNPAYMDLHKLTAFRQVIKKHAKSMSVTLVTDKEPGVQTSVKGKLVSANKTPLANTLVYVYQTDHRGWYADDKPHVEQNEGDRGHARLFGYLKTNAQGEFELHTIRPASYPNSTLPQHIHFEAFSNNGSALIITELLFDDDPMLVGELRERFLREGFVVAKNTGTKEKQLFSYTVMTR